VLDLSCLLLTGRASEALSDFLGSGEQTTERVSRGRKALMLVLIFHVLGDEQMGVHRLRGIVKGARLCGEAGCACCAPTTPHDRGGTRVGPTVMGSETPRRSLSLIAHIIRPNFAFCEFSASEAKGCLQAIQRLIMMGNWLAKTARVELTRFREFMGWLRYGKNSCGCIRTWWLIRHGWRVGFTL